MGFALIDPALWLEYLRIAREPDMTREKLNKEAITAALAELEGWSLAADGASIKRSFGFKNFSEA
ncbi:MAG: hypothetical protein E5X90_14355, partial [Mesorhizobium sp.]